MAGTAKRCISCLRTWSYLGWTLTGLIILSVFSAVSADDSHNHNDIIAANVTSGSILDEYRNHSIDQLLSLRHPLFYEYNFDPEHLEERLIAAALRTKTPPEQYKYELKLLIGSVGTNRQDFPKRDLMKKYDVHFSLPNNIDPDDDLLPFPDMITFERLVLMFPQYFRFDLVELDVQHFNPQCQLVNAELPKIVKYPAFAGLIPSPDEAKGFRKNARNGLLRGYLLGQFCSVVGAEISKEYFKDLGAIGMKRIELSRVPNDLRIQFLKEKGLVNVNYAFPTVSQDYFDSRNCHYYTPSAVCSIVETLVPELYR
nr:PREDICTED: uncharacterized protein LOC109034639 isoform X1 [Bemisia tabaci]